MFPDQFLPNAAIFAIGIATAFWLLRSGMVMFGALVFAGTALGADLALVARFVYQVHGDWFLIGLWGMQALALGSFAWLVFAIARKRWSADSRRRDELMQAAFQHYLRDELSAARDLFIRLRRADPWDVAAAIGLANVRWRQGHGGKARALLISAKRLDRTGSFAGFLAEQQRRVANGSPRRTAAGQKSDPVADAALAGGTDAAAS
ncbi:MAG: hypothetical protein ABL997_01260 [Planctomycetota bacterium]